MTDQKEATGPVAWRCRTKDEPEWSYGESKLLAKDLFRKEPGFEEQPLYASQSSRIEVLEKALEEARAALKCSYDVIEFPSNGCTAQDTAIRTIDAVLSMSSADHQEG